MSPVLTDRKDQTGSVMSSAQRGKVERVGPGTKHKSKSEVLGQSPNP